MAINHLDEFSHVGLTETFEEDQDIILCALGLPVAKRKNIALNTNAGRPKAGELPEATIQLINELTELDRVLYEKAKAHKKTLRSRCLRMKRKILTRIQGAIDNRSSI